MNEIKVVLIDDEIPCIETLVMQIEDLNLNVKIVAKFNDPDLAMSFLSTNSFDILLLDIEMPGISGFELLNQLPAFTFDVIFTTAYNQYAIKAFKYSALNYLLKPIDDDELRDCFHSWLQKKEKNLNSKQFNHLMELLEVRSSKPDKIALPNSDGYEFIDTSEIVRCQADNYYTHFLMSDGKDLMVCRTLKEVELLLRPFGFIRIHQSHLVNPSHIKKFSRQDGGTIITSDSTVLSVSKGYKPELMKIFDQVSKL